MSPKKKINNHHLEIYKVIEYEIESKLYCSDIHATGKKEMKK